MQEHAALEESWQASLAERTARATDALKRMLAHLPFEDVAADEVDAIKFEYDWPSFVPIACPINRREGYKGSPQRLEILAPGERQVFGGKQTWQYLEAMPEDERLDVQDELDLVQRERYEAWFRTCWTAARSERPGLRGFLAIHDSAYLTDLDTGEKMREEACGIEAWAR